MKFALSLIVALITLSATQSFAAHHTTVAHAPVPTYKCDSDSDPDFVRADLYSTPNGSVVARIYQLSGDGDDAAYDTIALRVIPQADKNLVFLEQVPNVFPRIPGLKERSSHKTSGFKLRVALNAPGVSMISMHSGPTGSSFEMDIECSRVNPVAK